MLFLIILKILELKEKCDFEVFSGEKLLLNEYTGIRKNARELSFLGKNGYCVKKMFLAGFLEDDLYPKICCLFYVVACLSK